MADMFFLHSRKFTTRVFYTSCKQGWYGSIRVATWVEYALPEKLQEKFREMWLNGRVMQVSLRETETKAVADQYFGFNEIFQEQRWEQGCSREKGLAAPAVKYSFLYRIVLHFFSLSLKE